MARAAVRRLPLLEAEEATPTSVVLRPTIIDVPIWDDPPNWNQAPGTGGVNSLKDDSDSSTVHLREWASSTAHSTDLVNVRFDAVDVPDSFVPDSMYLIMRAREVGTIPPVTGGTAEDYYWPFLAGYISTGISTDTWDISYMDVNWHTHFSTLSTPPLSSTYQNLDSRGNVNIWTGTEWPNGRIDEIPTADAIRDGIIEGQFEVFHNGHIVTAEVFMDLAEVTLVICSDGSGDAPATTATRSGPMTGSQRRAIREARDGRE